MAFDIAFGYIWAILCTLCWTLLVYEIGYNIGWNDYKKFHRYRVNKIIKRSKNYEENKH